MLRPQAVARYHECCFVTHRAKRETGSTSPFLGVSGGTMYSFNVEKTMIDHPLEAVNLTRQGCRWLATISKV